MSRTTLRYAIVAIAVALLVASAEAATFNFACGGRDTLSKAISRLNSGDVLLVSGNCVENVLIDSTIGDVIVDGQNVATVTGVTTTVATFLVRGRNVTLRNFTITGGNDGILVLDGGGAVINGNTIEGNTVFGVQVSRNSWAKIVNNTIQTNALGGIFVTQNSSAEIGVFGGADTVASPNTVQNNAGEGVHVTRSSSVRIVGNTIANNALGGVLVIRASQADISSNAIDGNGGSGIEGVWNSTINLGRTTGTGIFDLPNSTTVNNTVFGVSCSNGFISGRLGTLNGDAGPSNVGACEGVLNP
jgi:parallel beta-helix repeat protein